MVATPITESLRRGDTALESAVAHLVEALDAFRRAGRADLAAPLRTALTAARQTELLRAAAPGAFPDRDPADWFLD